MYNGWRKQSFQQLLDFQPGAGVTKWADGVTNSGELVDFAGQKSFQ